MHPRNLHQGRYDFKQLIKTTPLLADYIIDSQKGDLTIDFSAPQAILMLNQALLKHFYQVDFWQLPAGYLCPPIPGRSDYIHYIADLLAEDNEGEIPTGKKIKALDIGTGANCIYPILGSKIYGWSFIGSDIDPVSVKTAGLIVSSNINLRSHVKVRLQKNNKAIFDGVINKNEKYAVTICNPPFHSSMEKMRTANARKVANLKQDKVAKNHLNFGGTESELSCEGGEIAFLKQMCKESVNYADQVNWFTSLISKSENVSPLKVYLKKLGASDIRVIKMAQGQKTSRILAWRFIPAERI